MEKRTIKEQRENKKIEKINQNLKLRMKIKREKTEKQINKFRSALEKEKQIEHNIDYNSISFDDLPNDEKCWLDW